MVDDAARVQTERRGDAAMGVDHGRDAVVGGADERDTFFYRPDPRLMQMLARSSGVAEPAVIGDVDDQAGTVVALDD